MRPSFLKKPVSRRSFLKWSAAAGFSLPFFNPLGRRAILAQTTLNPLFWIKNIPDQPFNNMQSGNIHAGVESLLHLMGGQGLKFYRSPRETDLSGPSGMIDPNDTVLIKVNAQWKYRGCTNSDLIRGLIEEILDHPDGFNGEVVIIENGQGRGSLNCDTSAGYSDAGVHANANDESHSFLYLVSTFFHDPRVSTYLLDPLGSHFIGSNDHVTDGYRIYENVSYPCFTTAGGRRVELREGLWQGSGYTQDLKLINVPVLKHHDTGGSEITASLKHFYGVVSMSDGQSSFRHYGGLGETCGKMMVSVRTPVLNIVDAIWVSYSSLTGYPGNTTLRSNQILASQDPVALDYWAAKYILYPIDKNPRHHPDFPGIDQWLTSAQNMINGRGGLHNPDSGILVHQVTKLEEEMTVHINAEDDLPFGSFDIPLPNATVSGPIIAGGWALDDVGVTRVELRSDIPFWPSLGDLYYTCGSRSDIAEMYPNYPNNDCAGWGIVWLTNFMSDYRDPRTGQRVLEGSTHQIFLRVYDTAGHYVDMGHRNVTIRNDGVEKPFGTINDPAPGSIVSGPVFLSGWALAKGGRRVTKVEIGLNEVPMWEAIYGVNWPVLTQFFPVSGNPGYPYSENAAFVFMLDTTLFPNGRYQLGALVTDEAGNVEGIGSRFIYIQN